jgi:hypothetical protein
MTTQKKFLVADTETTGLGTRAIVFDFAYIICTRTKILLERSFVIRDTITNPKVMLNALMNEDWRKFFGGKIFSHYIPSLASGELKLHSWRDVIETMRDDIQTHNVAVFSAYNLPFDMKALRQTDYLITGGQEKLLPYRLQLLDLYYFACVTVLNTRLYHDVAHKLGNEKGFITDAGNVRTTAEKTYAFLTGNYEFIEQHTALGDTQIEVEILQRLLAKRKTIPYDILRGAAWRYAQKIQGTLLDRRIVRK